MNVIETLARVFSGAPLGYVAGGTLRAFEVNHLPRNFCPAQCEVLARAHEPHPREGMRREYFLVQTDEALLYFRVCTAAREAGREFAVGQGYADLKDIDQAARLSAYAHQVIGTLSRASAVDADETLLVEDTQLASA